MAKVSKSKVAYIETNSEGAPCGSLQEFAQEMAENARLDNLFMYCGLTPRPAQGRRKVRLTVTVEDAE